MSEKTIDSILHENRVFPPSEKFVAQSKTTLDSLEDLRKQAAEDYEGFWADLAKKEIDWHRPFSTILNEKGAPHYRWFEDGTLNVSYNCLDRHLETKGNKTAIIFEEENGETRELTYKELHYEVCVFANALKDQGIEKGDRVIIYMPLVPEATIAMQACARIGAVHSVVFGGFSSKALKDRIEDAGAKMVITADGGTRGGKIVALKKAVDEALETCSVSPSVIVLKHSKCEVNMQEGRDIWWHDATYSMSNVCEPVWVEAEHPLFLLYTSGSTGKPKGIQHSTGGYLLGTILTMKWVFDIQDEDIYWCTADVGWITGHSYVTYGPLATGSTMVMYEGAPTIPDAGRFWDMCERHKVTIFYTAPTAIRALMKCGNEIPAKYDLSSLRLLGTVGEPINPEAWMWYHETIGGGNCPIVDTWWQTETGAIMLAPIPGAIPTKPGSCTQPLPGIMADIVDTDGNSIKDADKGGLLVIRKPWPSMLRTVWGDDKRYKETYWGDFDGKYYIAGDSARCDIDGYFWIMGRTDDVLNVSGHRLGTMEIESALVSNPKVAEAAVVSRPDDVTGEAIFAYVVLKGARPENGSEQTLTNELRDWVGKEVGAIAKPATIRFADNLPKTRSGKIMRRLLRTIAEGNAITQDTSTLEDESILHQLQGK
jgi:acetyl-CoA synthetase